MSRLIAKVLKIDTIGNLNITTFTCNDIELTMMSLDIDKNIIVGKEVVLTCKPSSIAIAKNFQGEISFSNRLKCKVTSIQEGELLSIISLEFGEFKLESLITTKSIKRISIKEGEYITAFIKASELSIMECLDD